MTCDLEAKAICLEIIGYLSHVEWDGTLTAVVLCEIGTAECDLQDGGKALQNDQTIVEAHFVFACVWAFGGCLAVEKTADHRAQFSRYWVSEWKTIAFPDQVRDTLDGICSTCTTPANVHPPQEPLHLPFA